jgi:hypothetical protein
MINSEMQTVCIERMKDIIGIYGREFKLINVSKENIDKIFLKVADVRIKPNVNFSATVKHALYNLENFRPEIRSAIELQLFNVWHNSFKTLDIDQSEDIEPEILSSSDKEVSVVEEIVEKSASANEVEPGAKEIAEEFLAANEVEPQAEVKEVTEEPVLVQLPETIENKPEMISFNEDKQQAEENKSESPEQAVKSQADKSDGFPKNRRQDLFDLFLDLSANLMTFFIRVLFRK